MLSAVKMLIEDIIISISLPYKEYSTDRPIVVDKDRVLILGKLAIEKYKAMGIKEVNVFILDLEALLYKRQFLDKMIPDLLPTEKGAIGLRLEQVIDNYADLPWD